MRRLPPALLLALALTGCGATEASAPPPSDSPPSSTADPVNVTACRQYEEAADNLVEMAKIIGPGESNGSMIIALQAESALEDMAAGASLASADVRAAMDRSVAAVRIIQSGAASSPNGLVSMTNEIQAVRLTVAEVVRLCGANGADLAISI